MGSYCKSVCRSRGAFTLRNFENRDAEHIMESDSAEISIKGRLVKVPSLRIGERTVIVSGGWLKTARVRDEDWLEGEAVDSPEEYIQKIKREGLNADIFSFGQKVPNVQPKYCYPMEWDNIAAIPTVDYTLWWEQRLPQETRKNVRRARKRGVLIREVQFSDELMRGIIEINNETPVRQGRPFWHYRKNFDVVRKDYATLLDRSEFIGAYYEDQLIGFIKMVYMGDIAGILQVLCMNKHSDKRLANLLIARAVEICCAKGCKFLVYGKYIYGSNANSPLTEFKRRNGFEQVLLPRYYVPLSIKGGVAVQLKLQLGFKRLLPQSVQDIALDLRARWYEATLSRKAHGSLR